MQRHSVALTAALAQALAREKKADEVANRGKAAPAPAVELKTPPPNPDPTHVKTVKVEDTTSFAYASSLVAAVCAANALTLPATAAPHPLPPIPLAPPPPQKNKIYYLSRTHTQLKQVVRQLEATHPQIASTVRMTIIGGREHLCINQHARSFKETKAGESLDDACVNLCKKNACRLKAGIERVIDGLREKRFFDIEESVTMGKKEAGCPYFAVKELHEEADIIMCPYNYVFDEGIRKASSISLANAVVIIDEGHNSAGT